MGTKDRLCLLDCLIILNKHWPNIMAQLFGSHYIILPKYKKSVLQKLYLNFWQFYALLYRHSVYILYQSHAFISQSTKAADIWLARGWPMLLRGSAFLGESKVSYKTKNHNPLLIPTLQTLAFGNAVFICQQ